MKKNEKTNDEVSKETVSKTTWRLKSAPSLDDIARALELDLITKEQATEMLVKVEQEEVADPATYNDLKKEIEFLRGLILNIMNNPTTNTIVKYIESYPLRYNPWVQPYVYAATHSLPQTWMSTTAGTGGTTFSINAIATGASTTGSSTTGYINSDGKLVSMVKAMQDGKFNGSSDSNNRYTS